ncbi:MAG: hypothetical protein NTW14_00930 [bacterium]|nr:hypothetical protein [bacterium]
MKYQPTQELRDTQAMGKQLVNKLTERTNIMARTESISFQVHPNDEQEQINLMQQFHWSLLTSQEIKTVDSHLEQRGDDIYSVTNSEHYVKLTFSRELDLPNLNEIKRLEQSFFSLPVPKYPKLFPGTIWLYLVLSLFYGAGIVIWVAYFLMSYKPKKEEADCISQDNDQKRQQILTELAKFN